MYINLNKRVDKADTLQAESSLSELSFENKGFRSRGAHRASPCRERFLRYTPAKTAFFTSERISPLTIPQILEFLVFRQFVGCGKNFLPQPFFTYIYNLTKNKTHIIIQ